MLIQQAAVAAVQGDVMLIALSSIPHSSHVMKLFLPMPCHENSESLFGLSSQEAKHPK
jgi:hypothetical protein